jgi:hypothetical protein
MRAFTTTPNTSMGRAWRMQAHRKLPDPSSPLCMAFICRCEDACQVIHDFMMVMAPEWREDDSCLSPSSPKRA